jgi:hypothetical protein
MCGFTAKEKGEERVTPSLPHDLVLAPLRGQDIAYT